MIAGAVSEGLELLLLLFYRTAHVSLVLHAVASCALLAQLVNYYSYMRFYLQKYGRHRKGSKQNLFEYVCTPTTIPCYECSLFYVVFSLLLFIPIYIFYTYICILSLNCSEKVPIFWHYMMVETMLRTSATIAIYML